MFGQQDLLELEGIDMHSTGHYRRTRTRRIPAPSMPDAFGPGRQHIRGIVPLVSASGPMSSQVDKVRRAFPWRRRVMVAGDAERYVALREQAHDRWAIPTGVTEFNAATSLG